MKLMKMFTLGSRTLTVLSILVASQASLADNIYKSEYVKAIDLSFPGQAAVVTIKNISANKHINSINLKVQQSALNFDIDGFVECKSANKIRFRAAWAYYGSVGIGGLNNLNTTSTVDYKAVDISYIDKKHKITENTEDTFSVAYSKLKNAHPVLRVDALMELNKKLQAYVQGGGTAVDFYKQDHDIVLQRPISLVALCGTPSESGYGIYTKNHTVQIKYQGDPAINDKPVLQAQLNGNTPNQFNQGKQNFKLTSATFAPNIPHYIGKCIPDKNPKIRINYQGNGTEKGLVDLNIRDGSAAAGGTNGIVVDPTHGAKYWDYELPLIEMMQYSPNKDEYLTPNKTIHHELKIRARYKNLVDGTWSAYEDFGTATFNHRCVPQVTIPLGGNGAKFNNGDTNKPLQIKAVPINPPSKPLTIQTTKPKEKDPGSIRAQPIERKTKN